MVVAHQQPRAQLDEMELVTKRHIAAACREEIGRDIDEELPLHEGPDGRQPNR